MSSLTKLLKGHRVHKAHKAHKKQGRAKAKEVMTGKRSHNGLRPLLLTGILATAPMALILPGQTATGTLLYLSDPITLITRITPATCDLSQNDVIPVGPQTIVLPTVHPTEVNLAGEGEWLGDIVPLNLGLHCSINPETGVGMSLVIKPAQVDVDYTSAAAIASVKPDGTLGPDLLIVNTTNSSNAPVSFHPKLLTSGHTCGDSGQDCVKLAETGINTSEWRLPLGVRVLIPAAGDKRTMMLTPGTWQAAVTLNIAYQ